MHVLDDALVVLVTSEAALTLGEQVPQLHADHQTGHAQEDVAPQLQHNHT